MVVGQAVADKWVVESGLQPGDQVVTEGLQKIRPGAEIRVAAAPAPAPAAKP